MALELINNLDTAGNAFNKNNEAINNIIVSGALNGNVLTYTTFSGATIEVTLPITESGVVLTTQSGSIDIAGVDPACTVEVPALQYTYNALGKTTFSASFAFVSPDPTLDRVDSVVLNPVTNSVSIVNGTPANPPVSPTITDPNFLLGSIYVFAGQPCENSVFIYSAINTQLATILSQLTIDLINGAGGGDTIPVYDGTLYVNESTIGGNGSFANPFETMEDAINSVAVDTPTLIVCLGDNPNVGVGLIDLSGKDIYIDARGKDIAYDHDVFDVNNSRDFSLHCQNIVSLNGSSLVTTETKTATIRVDGTITNNNTGSLADLAVFEGNRFDVKAGIYEGTAPLFSNLAIAPALGSICELDYINMPGGVFTFTGGGYIKLKLKVNIMATAVVSGAPQFMANLASGSIIEGNYNITGDFINHGGDFNQFITFKNCNASLTGRLTPNNNNVTLDNSVINCVANPTLNVVLIGWTIRNNSRINCNIAGYALVFEPSSTITDSIISNSNAGGDCVAMQGGIAIDCIAIKSSNARTGFLNLGAGSTGNQETPSLAVTPTGTELLNIQEDGNTSKTVTAQQIADLYLQNAIIVTQSNVATTLGGTIDSNKEYFLDGQIDMGTTTITIPANGIKIVGFNFDNSGLYSTEDNYTMFESPVGGSGNILGRDFYIDVSGVNSQVYNITDATGFNAFEFQRVNYNNCTSLGTITDYRQGLEDGTGRFGGTPTLTLEGTWVGGFRITTSIVRNLDSGMSTPLFCGAVGFTMASRFITDINVDLPALAPFCDFTPSNFPNPNTLNIQDTLMTVNGSDNTSTNSVLLFPNVSENDLCSYWKRNIGVNNTFVGVKNEITAETLTTINTIDVFETVLGTWTQSDVEHFDSITAGSARHLANSPREFKVTGKLTFESPANNDIRIHFTKWDNSTSSFSVLTQSEQIQRVRNSVGSVDLVDFNVSFVTTLDENDYILLRVANATNTDNVTLENGSSFRVEER